MSGKCGDSQRECAILKLTALMSRAAKIIAAALLEDSVEHDTESDEAFSDVDPTYEYESDTSSCPSGVSERTMALLMDSPPSGANAVSTSWLSLNCVMMVDTLVWF